MKKLQNFFQSPAFLPFSLLAFIAIWAWAWPSVYVDGSFFLLRDNQSTNYPMFGYIGESLRYLNWFPSWVFTNQGGVWIEPLTNNYLTLLPHRLVGYLLAWLTSIPLSVLYKWTVQWVGQGAYLAGIFWLARRFWPKGPLPWCLVGAALTSSVTLGVLHQEQVLGTVFYLPFTWLALLSLRSRGRNVVWLAALMGLAVNTQYPQLFLLYLLAMIWAACFSAKESSLWFRQTLGAVFAKANWPWLGLAALVFIVSASPLLYSVVEYKDQLVSPFRAQTGGIEVPNYEAYLRLHAIRYTSLQLSDLELFFQSFVPTGMRFLDDKICFVGPAVALMLILFPVVRFAFRGFQLAVVAILLFFALGVHLEAARLLWYILPGIALFRQWYHLAPILIVHLLVLVIFTLSAFFSMRAFSRGQVTYLVLGALALFGASAAGFLPWMHGVLPAFLILFKLYQARMKPSASFSIQFAVGIWFFLGNLAWAIPTMQEALLFSDPTEVPTPRADNVWTREKFATRLWMEGYPIRSLANPKGVEPGIFLRGFQSGGIQWRLATGEMRAVGPGELAVGFADGEWRLQLQAPPATTSDLVLLQFNDGRWHYPGAGSQSLVIQIPVGAEKQIALRRSASLWQTLIVLCWMPLVGLCLQAAPKYFSNRSIRRRHKAWPSDSRNHSTGSQTSY